MRHVELLVRPKPEGYEPGQSQHLWGASEGRRLRSILPWRPGCRIDGQGKRKGAAGALAGSRRARGEEECETLLASVPCGVTNVKLMEASRFDGLTSRCRGCGYWPFDSLSVGRSRIGFSPGKIQAGLPAWNPSRGLGVERARSFHGTQDA